MAAKDERFEGRASGTWASWKARGKAIPLDSLWLPGAVAGGLLLGLALPPLSHSTDPAPWDKISQVLGWTYFFAWSVSFYPQVFLNYQRKSVEGLSLDFQVLNLVGFLCYAVYNSALFWSPTVQRQYSDANSGHANKVQDNDVFFSFHAVLLTIVTLIQMGIYTKWGQECPPMSPADHIIRKLVLIGVSCTTVVVVVVAVLVSTMGVMTWYHYVTMLSIVKVIISVAKYMPQVYMNYSRKSTDGWNISNVLLDFTGGTLSVAQLVVDCASTHDWEDIVSDPGKLMLGNLSMIFDVIFMVQHYCLYRDAPKLLDHSASSLQDEEEGGISANPLLDNQ